MKKVVSMIMMLVLLTGILTGCGGDSSSAKLTGTCEEILGRVYENASLDDGMREAMQYFQQMPVDESSEEYILGTTDVEYTDSVYSAPAMSSVAYQCVILRLSEGQDSEEAKQLLLDNADTGKWICVEAESVVVENVGDVVLYVMADNATAEAVKAAFLSLK